MLLRISHTTRFAYDAPAYQSHNEVRMRPVDSAAQKCLEFVLEVEPPASMFEFDDFYGNRVHSFSIYPQHDVLQITSRSLVQCIEEQPPSAPTISFENFSPMIARGCKPNTIFSAPASTYRSASG